MDTNRDPRRHTSFFAAAVAAIWLSATSDHAQTAPTLMQGPLTQAVTPGSTVHFTAAASGAGPLLYQWRFNGANISGLISTVAGNGTNSFSGDGGAAANASLNDPRGVAVDASGNLFIADSQNARIREVTTNGLITTFAGNGSTNYSGDGSQATNAGLVAPVGVAVDGLGNVFICDSGDGRVRQVDANGIITTVAGGGTNNIGDGGPATNATLLGPKAAAVDALGNLFIADSGNGRIRRVGADGIITTVAGGGTNAPANGEAATNAQMLDPHGVAIDSLGNLFISFSASLRGGVFKVDTNGLVTLLPVGLSYQSWSNYWQSPAGLALDVTSDLFVADSKLEIVLKMFAPYAGDGSAGFSGDGGVANQARLSNPVAVTLDAAGNVFIADEFNNRIRKIAAQGPVLSLGNVTFTNAGEYDVVVSSPYGSVTSSVATLFVGHPLEEPVVLGSNLTLSVDVTNAAPFTCQWQFNGTNLPLIITTVAGNGLDGESGDGGLATNAMLYAGGVATDASGDFFIADSANDRVRKVNASGVITTVAGDGATGYSGDGASATNASLDNPVAVAVNARGDLYIADELNNRIRRVTANGIISTVAGDGSEGYSGDGVAATNTSLSHPVGVALDGSGNLYIADGQNNRIRQVGPNGLISTIAGNGTNGFSGDGGPATNASLSFPVGLALDASGNLFIADSGNRRIRQLATNGLIRTVAGNGEAGYYGDGGLATNAFLESPASVAVDLFGNLFIADTTEHIRQVGLNGIISTVAGNAGFGYSGDGGPPANARLSEVYGLAADLPGDLFMADTGNNRIRKISAFQPDLPLVHFTPSQAGVYDLIVSNAFGSTTSAVIVLKAVLPPLAASITGGHSVQLQFIGAPGSNYVLQVAANLTPPVVWRPLATNSAGIDGSGTFTDTNTLASPARFYRLALP